MDLLFVTDGDKLHYVYIKDFDRFIFHQTKNKNKKLFCRSCLQSCSNKNVLTNHKQNFLSINGAQSVNQKKELLSLKIIANKYIVHLKFIVILSVIWKEFKFMKVLTQENIIIIFLVVLLTKLFLLSRLLFLGVKALLMNLLRQFLKSINTVKN